MLKITYCAWKGKECERDVNTDCYQCPTRIEGVKALHPSVSSVHLDQEEKKQ